MCRLLLDSNPPAVLVGALLTASQLARLHRDNYNPLAKAGPYPQLRKLLSHTEPAVRARVCNLLGNMCRHSAYFYTALDRHGLLPPLIQRCTDEDRATRKFACFAIGNAGGKHCSAVDLDSVTCCSALAKLRTRTGLRQYVCQVFCQIKRLSLHVHCVHVTNYLMTFACMTVHFRVGSDVRLWCLTSQASITAVYMRL